MKAKAYIESKYKKLNDEERERREGKIHIILLYSLGETNSENGLAKPK